jgi:hypothetical protein
VLIVAPELPGRPRRGRHAPACPPQEIEDHHEPLAPPPEEWPPELELELELELNEEPLDESKEELVDVDGSGSRGVTRALVFSQPQWRQRSLTRSTPVFAVVAAWMVETVCDFVTAWQRGQRA